MKKRPLCTLCLTFLMIKSILLMLTSGQTLVKVPASSIFFGQTGKTEVVIQGQVYKKTSTSKIQILYLKNSLLLQDDKSYQESNILIYDDTFSQVPIGKTICVRGKITPFERARNPGNFDQQLYYAKQNIYGFVWSEEMMSISGEENWLLERLYQIRQRWKAVLQENMSEENGAVLSAMLLGERSEMDADLKEQYQQAGISHVLAISGLHISFIGLGIYKVIRRSGASYASAGVLAMLVLSMYVLMLGFSVSVIRAFVMLLLRIGADMTGRVYDMLTALMLAATIIVRYQPLYLTDGAFYMSHGAILGILVVLPQIKKIFPKSIWLEGTYAGLAINMTLFPVLLWFYFEFSIFSMLMNLAVIPLMSLVLGFGMLGSAGCFIWNPVGKGLLSVCDGILSIFHWLSEKSCQLPFGRLTLGKPCWWEILIYYVVLIGFLFLLWKCKNRRHISRLRGIGVLYVIFTFVLFTKFPNGKLQVTMLDVGQGDCIFMKGPKGDTYLVDGGSSDVKQVGKYRMEPFLKSQGVGQLDYVFVSHGDMDHYSGIEEMLNRQLTGVKIKMLVLPSNYRQDEELVELAKLAAEQEIGVAVINADQSIVEGDLRIQCLQPDAKEEPLLGNAGSMVLDVSFKNFDMLFTGDVEEEGEKLLLKNLPKKSYDILKVAHHGSKYSTVEAFLRLTRPRIGWISAGEGNSYGHPHEETLKRLEGYHCKIYQTSKYGAISVETDGDFIDIFPSSI